MSEYLTQHIEREAIAAHRDGELWNDWWAKHGADVRRAEPFDRRRFGRLYLRLFSLVTSGDLDGQRAVGDPEPWATDDAGDLDDDQPDDTTTAAKLQPGYLFDARPLGE